jgi:acyl-CoA thioesterase
VTARLEQDGRLVALAIAAFSKARRGAVDFADAKMPAALPVSQSQLYPKGPPLPAFTENWDMRGAFDSKPLAGGEQGLVGGWVRPVEPQPWDYALLAQLTDVWFPAVFLRLDAPNPVPTIDLTVHFRAELPQPDMGPGDHVLATFRSRVAAQGFVEEDGELWSPGGVLMAQSRQLALLQAPSHG